jgi:hypothetical protein
VYVHQIMPKPFRCDAEGHLAIPTRPVLGIELNREALQWLGS